MDDKATGRLLQGSDSQPGYTIDHLGPYKNVDAQVLSQPNYIRIFRYPYFVKASQECLMCNQHC